MNGFYFEEVTGSHKLSPKCGLPQPQHLASSSEHCMALALKPAKSWATSTQFLTCVMWIIGNQSRDFVMEE